MMRWFSFLLAAVWLIAVTLPGAVVAQAAGSLVRFERAPLTIRSGDRIHEFDVELALSERQQTQGLMYRRQLAPDGGMLFVYRQEGQISMWMKNTYIPLDMLFIGRDGKILKIAERTVPMSEAIVSSGGPAKAVLELNAGTASRLGLKPGDLVVSAALGS
ncbi:MAG: DUF192 domain-containing protein [Rhodospirillaceae bacterium]